MAERGMTDIVELCRKGLDAPPSTCQQQALKTLANTLLLEESARQILADTGCVGKIADRLVQPESLLEEAICCRILFLLTYGTSFRFDTLFIQHNLVQSLLRNLHKHGKHYKEESASKDEGRITALSEELKLLFNLTTHYPDQRSPLLPAVPVVWDLLHSLAQDKQPLEAPQSYCINFLLNLSSGDELEELKSVHFPRSSSRHTDFLVKHLQRCVDRYDANRLEAEAIPSFTLIRSLRELAPDEVVCGFKADFLPAECERDQPLGRSASFAAKLLRLTGCPATPRLNDAIFGFLFDLCDKDAARFVHSIGYGYAAGFLINHKIPLPKGQTTGLPHPDVNPVTGQFSSAEPTPAPADMTPEEKEREAERLFVLFERLNATGVMKVVNPLQEAVQNGAFQDA